MSSTAVIDPKAVALLGRGRIHPALHADERGVVVGRVTGAGEYQFVTSTRDMYEPEQTKAVLAFTPRVYADLAGRWVDADAEAWLAGGEAPTFSETLALTMHAFDEAMEFPRAEHGALLATWAVASYFHPLFLTFPRLALSGERESGKSKVLALLRATAWNALLMLNPTPAVLYRLVQEFRPTLLLDEVEGLSKDDAREVLAIVNAGYKAGATVPRCEGERRKVVESFAVYGPLALAAIRSPNATTEDRCIPVVLQRGADRRRLNAEVDPRGESFTRIRSGCYRLLLSRWTDVREAYQTVALPSWLNARARELWKPLLAVAAVADRENGLALTPDLLALAREHVNDRPGATPEAEALLAVLTEVLGDADAATVRPGELREDLRLRLGWKDAPNAEAVAAWLRRLLFRRTGKDRAGARYEIHADQLRAVTARYTPETTVTPPPSHAN